MHSTPVSDDQLDEIVAKIQQQFPLCGNRQMLGHLLARGLRVQQIRVREAQRRVDPEGSVMRRLRTINRRSYSIAAPRSLWHIDGNHKLRLSIGWVGRSVGRCNINNHVTSFGARDSASDHVVRFQ